MSRDVRRVPLDFTWPLNKVWQGYLMPAELRLPECPACEGQGWSPEAKLLMERWYGKAPFRPEDRGSTPLTASTPAVRAFAERNVSNAPWYYGTGEAAIVREAERLIAMWNQQWCHHLNQDDVDALVAAGRLYDFTHTWTPEDRWQPKHPAYRVTAAEVNEWAILTMGHDSINQHVVVRAELERLGQPVVCSTCLGKGNVATDEQRAAEEAWEPTEPPTGEGWQLWETVSEGSPISPVFPDRGGLLVWLTTEYTANIDRRPISRAAAEALLDIGHTAGMSFAQIGGEFVSGEEALVRGEADRG